MLGLLLYFGYVQQTSPSSLELNNKIMLHSIFSTCYTNIVGCQNPQRKIVKYKYKLTKFDLLLVAEVV